MILSTPLTLRGPFRSSHISIAQNMIVTINVLHSHPPPLTSHYMQEKCSICFETKSYIFQTSLNCGHSFHSHCLHKWARRSPSCPLCRAHADPSVTALIKAVIVPLMVLCALILNAGQWRLSVLCCLLGSGLAFLPQTSKERITNCS